jgi:hypothetical protein
MQPNEIDLQVDTLNDGGTIVQETYTRFEEFLNRSKYVGDSHTMSSRDELTLYRTFPKQAGNFKGVGKSAAKFAIDVSVPGVDETTSLTAPIIMEISFSIPVGATPASILLARQRGLALLDLDSVMNPLNEKLMV